MSTVRTGTVLVQYEYGTTVVLVLLLEYVLSTVPLGMYWVCTEYSVLRIRANYAHVHGRCISVPSGRRNGRLTAFFMRLFRPAQARRRADLSERPCNAQRACLLNWSEAARNA